ncbi:rab11 family-interacting protein 5 [Pholidichthys leucotaenia]
MMSLIDLDDDQRWVPTHVNVTVLRARGLRTKGKHGSRYLYTIIQAGKEKYTTGLVEKAEVPVWNEECCFELLPGILEEGGRSAYPPGSGDLVLTVMHRVLIGLDVFLGQAVVPLDKIFQDGVRPRDEWLKLNSKAGRKEKERGELQVTVQFTRNNMTASMFDLTMKDKPRSAFGKLKDRVTGRKRGDVESSSAIVPGRYAALSGSMGQPFGEEGGGLLEPRDVEVTEERRSKVKDFFKGRLRKSSDTRSCSSLASDSSMSSMASDNLGPPPSLDLLSDPPSSPIYTSKVRVDSHYGETDLAKKVLTSQHTTKVFTHKRAFSDEASKITTSFPRTNPTVESLKGQTMTQSKSSLCINGSHVYDSEPSTPKSSGALPSKMVLLEKCSPLSRSLQNLTKRNEDRGSFAEGQRWSFDKVKRDDKEEEKEASSSSSAIQEPHMEGRPVQAAMPVVSSAADSADKGRKLKKTLFSGGRSDSLPAKSDLNQGASTSEGRLRGWFGSGDSQNKPRLEVSPKALVAARHSLLPEETQPASNLPLQESRPHPVKPLTSSQSEKKEGRSVLEKLKSTIHPGRTAHQASAESEKSQEVTVDRSAQYQHLTNMELISLLLQQEMDMQKQQVASQQQEAQLEKCEAELKKVKLQVRDLEDYIDNLLLRIMEQTPTLLQVRARYK